MPAADAREGKDVPGFARPTASRIAMTMHREPAVEMMSDAGAREARVARALKEHERSLAAERMSNPDRFAVTRAAAAAGTPGGLGPLASAGSAVVGGAGRSVSPGARTGAAKDAADWAAAGGSGSSPGGGSSSPGLKHGPPSSSFTPGAGGIGGGGGGGGFAAGAGGMGRDDSDERGSAGGATSTGSPAQSSPPPSRGRSRSGSFRGGPGGADGASLSVGPTRALDIMSAAVLEALAGDPALRAFDTARPPALSLAALLAGRGGVLTASHVSGVCRMLTRVLAPLSHAVTMSPRGFADFAAVAVPLLTSLPAASPAFEAAVEFVAALGRQITTLTATTTANIEAAGRSAAGGGGGGGGGDASSGGAGAGAGAGGPSTAGVGTSGGPNQLTSRSKAKMTGMLPAQHAAVVTTTLGQASKFPGTHAASAHAFAELCLPSLLACARRDAGKRAPLMEVVAAFCMPPRDAAGVTAPPAGGAGDGSAAGSAAAAAAAAAAGGAGGMEPWQRDVMAVIMHIRDELAAGGAAGGVYDPASSTAAAGGGGEDRECLAVCVAALASRAGPVPDAALADLLMHEASAALACASPHARAAGLALLRGVLPAYPARVLSLLPRIAELAEDRWWEVRMQLTLLLARALGTLLSAGASYGPPGSGSFLSGAAAALGVPPSDAAAVIGLCEEALAGVVSAEPPAAVLHAFVGATASLLRAAPSLLGPFADALARLPRETRLALLSLAPPSPLSGAGAGGRGGPASAASGGARVRSGIGAVYSLEESLPALPGSALIRAVADGVARSGAQQLELGYFDVLLASCVHSDEVGMGSGGRYGGMGGGGGSGSLPPAYLAALQPLQDHIFVGLCDPLCGVAASELLRTVLLQVPGAVSLLSAPMLLGAIALVLQPPGGAERDPGAEERVAALLEEVAVRGPPFDRAVADALTAFATRYAPLWSASSLPRLLDSPALIRFRR